MERAVVGFAYVAAVATAFRWTDAGTALLAAVLVSAAAASYLTAFGRRRRERLYALQVTTVFAVLLVLLVVLDLSVSTSAGRSATLLTYQLALWIFAPYLVVLLLQAPWEQPGVTDLVVELGQAHAPTLRDALARALGDPTLEVGYRIEGRDGYVDASGRRIEFPPPGDRRRVTRLEREEHEVAVIIHDPGVLDDPVLIEATAAAARLAAANAQLQAEVRAQVSELEASRRRLLDAGDDERRRLEGRLHDGATRRLEQLGERLARIRVDAGGAVRAQVDRAEAQLAGTVVDLNELAAGLHPRELTEHGLAAALASLVERSPIPVELSVPEERLPADVEATVFFVCSEALANVTKYSNASSAAVLVSVTDDAARVEITDDGVGGASPVSGSGLSGLGDRVEAVGGVLELESPLGRGTRVAATIPRH